ncbi:hypothetical protein LJC38_00120 [Parabacteroides sp. OttesenSCG-928-K15]|nr:hypothetical protein [Parabacteroides sp. OttesenSCG-928-K15]
MAKRKKNIQADKVAVQEWELLVKSIMEETSTDDNLSFVEREKLRQKLEADPIEWIYYMFPQTARYKFAPFHIKFIRRIIDNPEWYEVLSWARELAKSSTVRMVMFYLILTGKLKNILLVSATQDSAIRLFRPYRAHLEANNRIKQLYGDQVGLTWKEDEIITRGGVAVRALGAGNKPRGTSNNDIRPDCLLIDDYDTDEECRNPDIIKNKWDWFEQALYFTRSWSEPLRTIWCGNIIAEDCCITRAGAKARELAGREKPLGNWDIINIRMVKVGKPDPINDFLYGTSVWPNKNTEENIEIVLAQTSSTAAQKECFNNPVQEGAIFTEMKWGKVPPLEKFPFLIAYADPSPSNNTKAKANSYKGLFLMGIINGVLYVITGYLDRVVNSEFVNWFYYLDDYVKGRNTAYNYIENNKLQDAFYQQVYIPAFAAARDQYGKIVNISPDERKKPEKAIRIEGGLEPLNRQGNLVLNEAEKDNPHMKRLEDQFKKFNLRLTFPADGPDCIEGGFFIANMKLSQFTPGAYSVGKSRAHNNKY